MSAMTELRDPGVLIERAKAIGAITPDALSGDLLNLVKSQICKPKFRQATDDELAYFVGVCMRTQLDPFARQIYAIFRRNKDGQEVLSIQTSIDGFRLIAERTGKYEGGTDPQWCDAEGKWTDVWTADGNPHAAKVGVWKTGAREPTVGIGYWRFYYDSNSPMWKSGGPHQLAKCSEALALRRAFPQELSGLYTVDEMATNVDAIDAEVVSEPAAIPEHAAGDEAMALDADNLRLMTELGYNDRRARAQWDGYRTIEQKRELFAKLTGLLDQRNAEESA